MKGVRIAVSIGLALVLLLAMMPGLGLAVGTTSWGQAISAGLGTDLRGVAQLSEEVVVVVSGDSIYRSINGGETWGKEWGLVSMSFDTVSLWDVCFVDDQIGWAVGRYGDYKPIPPFYDNESLILKTTDGGNSWTRQDDQAGTTEPALRAVDAADANNVLAVGDSGAYYRTSDGGANWGPATMPGAGSDCAWADSDHFIVVGPSGFIMRGWDMGIGFSWQDESSPGITTKDLRCVDFVPGTDDAFAFGDGEFRISTGNYGDTWSYHNMTPIVPYSFDFFDVDFADASNGWVVGQRYHSGPWPETYVLGTTNGGTNWTSVGVEDDHLEMYAVDAFSSVEGWAVGQIGSMRHLATTTSQRKAGTDRYQTAIEISQATFPDEGAWAVVVATGRGFPDALSAAGLAGVVRGPLLLVGSTVSQAVLDEIERLGANTVFIVGGTGVVSEQVEDVLDDTYTVKRIEGADRYATSAAVAEEIEWRQEGAYSKEAFIARGDAFPDALAVAPFAYSQKIPVLLTRPTATPQATLDVITTLDIENAYIAGGEGAVSGDVKTEVDALLVANGGSASERWAGADRYQTAVTIAGEGLDNGWGWTSYMGVATGLNYPDALAGGVACGAMHGSLLLTMPDSLHPHVEQFISDRSRWDTDVHVFGGEGAVSAAVKTKIDSLY